MAHEIEVLDGVAQAAYAFEPAWHRLGIVLPRFIKSREALELVPVLASHISKVPVEYNGLQVPNKYLTVRDADKHPLGVVGDRYRVLQNTEALDILDSLVEGGEAQYESVISLRGGATVALVVNLKDLGVQVGGVDQVDSYLLLSNSHDGSSAVTATVTPVRVVCANTLAWALEGAKIQHKVRHSTNMLSKLAEAKTILDITQTYMTAFEQQATTLMHQKMSDTQWEEFLGKLIVIPEKAGRGQTMAQSKHDDLNAIWMNLDLTAAEPFKGTGWGALQTVSHYNQRDAAVQAKGLDSSAPDFEEQKERRQAENRFMRTLPGNGSNLLDAAHDLLVAA